MFQATWLLPGAALRLPSTLIVSAAFYYGARARPSRLGWTCPRLPAALACAATLRPAPDADRAWELGGGLQKFVLAVARSPQRHSTRCTLVRSRETLARPRRTLGTQLSTCGLQTGRRGLHSR